MAKLSLLKGMTLVVLKNTPHGWDSWVSDVGVQVNAYKIGFSNAEQYFITKDSVSVVAWFYDLSTLVLFNIDFFLYDNQRISNWLVNNNVQPDQPR